MQQGQRRDLSRRNKPYHNSNKEALASAAARGVSFIFGVFLVKSLKTSSSVWFSSRRRCLGVFVHSSLVLFFGEVFAKVSQIPCF